MSKIACSRRLLASLVVAVLIGGAARVALAQLDLLVSSPTSGRVLRYDGATGEFLGVFVLKGSGGLSRPAGMLVGPDGKLYVATGSVGGTSAASNAVFRFDPATGAFLDIFTSGWPGGINGIAFGPDGNFYGAMYSANVVWVVDGTTGTFIREIGAGSGLSGATGVAFGPDGNLYVGSFDTRQVFRFNPSTGAFLGVFATVPVPGSGGNVGAVVFGPDGNLYVSLANTGNDIWRFDGTTGASLGSFIPAADPHPPGPIALRFASDGKLYVTCRDGDQVMRYDAITGAFIDIFASGRALDQPFGMAFIPKPEPGVQPVPPPLVDTTSGPVQGILEQGVLKWLGIPFAEPPVGALRWRRPVRRAASATPVDAIWFGPECPQGSPGTVGSEDCLSVSVMRREAPPETPLPVLMYIHGGGLSAGSAAGPAIDASELALAHDVVVVSIQYRLGALGFFGLPALAAEDPNGSTASYGFLDQLEALAWVRDNISAFGGDPARVTISGGSAGGISVCVLMASPLSDGLFQGGIMQSGANCLGARPLTTTPGSPFASDPLLSTTIYDRSQDVAALAGCAAGPVQLDCLRGRPAASLVQALASQPTDFIGGASVPPAIDGYVLSEQPITLLRQGAADGRPLIVGSVANEMSTSTVGLESVITSPAIYDFAVRSKLGNTRADALLPLYPAASYPSPAEAFRVLLDDTAWVCPTLDIADAIAEGGSPAWVYHLSFAPTYGPSSQRSYLRTFHGLEVYYLFGTYPWLGGLPYQIVADADDAAVSNSIQNAWVEFARTGAPSSVPAWPVYAPTTPGDLASVSVLQFDAPNFTTPGALFRSSRCAALAPVGQLLDPDRDVAVYDVDNCPNVANTSQADSDGDEVGDACDNCPLVSNASQTNSDGDLLGDACDNCATVANQDQADGGIGPVLFESPADGVGNLCDNCVNVANPRVAADFLSTNPWATLTGGQRDDDHDGFGNKCDGDFTVGGALTGTSDLTQWRSANGKARSSLTLCGSPAGQRCARYDMDESGGLIGTPDLTAWRLENGSAAGPRCPTCPLACTSGTTVTCTTSP